MRQPPASFRELLDRYRAGERDFSGAELDQDAGNDLSGVCLDGADLSRSYVVASFQRASLRGARFREANVKTCDFRGADLRDADFSGAALCSTRFDGARLDGARFFGASCHGLVLREGERPDW
jgi:uncharacterized protein YjbI with pentapeptide repeats